MVKFTFILLGLLDHKLTVKTPKRGKGQHSLQAASRKTGIGTAGLKSVNSQLSEGGNSAISNKPKLLNVEKL